eukprot:TRINITY_DN3541_c0_g2_i1.p1 TRINITY_DN3541_c0_g2~~TRINITY_DN3541_c0_g2_i1.p1  ORF type:complete len:750 (+),score=169.47 TRINITY_DN3541_c0_g2_i1:76-2250(+)
MWGVTLAAAAVAGSRAHGRGAHEFPLTVAARGSLRTGLEKLRQRRLHGVTPAPDQLLYAPDANSIPISDEGTGVYFDLYMGSHLQRQRVLFDTGSADLAVYSTLCKHCPTDNDLYDPTASGVLMPPSQCTSLLEQPAQVATPSGNITLCLVQDSYGDGSGWAGVIFWDVVSFQDEADGFLLNTTVEAIYDEHGIVSGNSSKPKGDFMMGDTTGIMGAAWQAMTSTGLPTPPEAYMEANNLTKAMSLCINENGGLIKLGGLLDYYTGDVQYEPLAMRRETSSMGHKVDAPSGGYWSVQVTDLAVGGTSLGLSPDSFGLPSDPHSICVVDSGTSALIVPEEAFKKLKDKLLKAGIDRDLVHNRCVPMDPAQFDSLPNVTITLTNATLTLYPQDYLSEAVCSAVGSATPYLGLVIDAGVNTTILGLPVLRRYMSVWDYDRKAVGFAVARGCPAGPIAAASEAYQHDYGDGDKYDSYAVAGTYQYNSHSGHYHGSHYNGRPYSGHGYSGRHYSGHGYSGHGYSGRHYSGHSYSGHHYSGPHYSSHHYDGKKSETRSKSAAGPGTHPGDDKATAYSGYEYAGYGSYSQYQYSAGQEETADRAAVYDAYEYIDRPEAARAADPECPAAPGAARGPAPSCSLRACRCGAGAQLRSVRLGRGQCSWCEAAAEARGPGLRGAAPAPARPSSPLWALPPAVAAAAAVAGLAVMVRRWRRGPAPEDQQNYGATEL